MVAMVSGRLFLRAGASGAGGSDSSAAKFSRPQRLSRKLARRAVLVSLAALAGIACVTACANEQTGIEACRAIEGARCENARSCGIDLTSPVHRGTSPSDDVGGCKRYYQDACLHGFAAPKDPGGVAVQVCVDAINQATDCEIVKAPEKSPACSFLVPPAVPVATAVADASVAD